MGKYTDDRDMNRFKNGSFDQAFENTFEKRRDYEGDFGESSRSSGWDQNFPRMRRSYDNFRNTQWGSGPHAGKGPKGWRRSDERIREEACEALYLDRRIDASEIEVAVEAGIITLQGQVDSRDTKRAVERCVEDIPGVTDVQNRLRVNDFGKEQGSSSFS